MGWTLISAVPGGTRTVPAWNPTVETVGYCLSPAGLGKGSRSVINRANGCGTGYGQAEFSAVPSGTRTAAAHPPTVETVGYFLSPAGLGEWRPECNKSREWVRDGSWTGRVFCRP